MSNRILITGGSGYLGGSLLAQLAKEQLPAYDKLFALVRKSNQADAVKQYGAIPILIENYDSTSIRKAISDNKISIVFHLFDTTDKTTTIDFIAALGDVKKDTGQDVHFLFTTGAKMFSEHACAPTSEPLLDTDPKLYDLQSNQAVEASFTHMRQAVEANTLVIDTAEAHGVRSYIFAPCIVYGEGLGFGNKISIQTVAIVTAAKKLRQVYDVNKGQPTWPVCHILDNTSLYLELLRAMLSGKEIGYGKNGYYLASPGSVAWHDIYEAISKALKKNDIVEKEEVLRADDEVLQNMANALNCSKEFVPVLVGGLCTFTAQRGIEIGWKPQFQPDHLLHTAQEEVDLVLRNLKD